jgi:hypothetical protein
MLYPPSDFVSQTIPAEAVPPGCGQEHRRPVGPDGLPVHPWGLSCSLCEMWLRQHDDRWVPTIAEIKLTHDQQKEHELLAVRGSADRDDIMMRALAKIAGIDVPASIGRPLPAGAPVTAMLACPQGHAQASGQPFCGQCGAPMRGTVPAAAIAGKAS